jgi:nucleoside-diphosphate-sugar epimerase
MKIFVTGSAGQVGSHIVDALLARGDSVLGIDNFATGRIEHVQSHERYRFVQGTIADTAQVDGLIRTFQPDCIVHTAASYKDPDDWQEDVATNVKGAVNLIQSAKNHGVARFVYFQTALIYGTKPDQNPITLNPPRRVDNSSYSISKGSAEDYLELSGISHVTFRLANVIGDRCSSGPLPIFYRRLMDGKPCFVTDTRRDFVFVHDLVKISLRAITGEGKGAYHFSSGQDVAIQELYDEMVKALEISPYPAAEVMASTDDNAASILLDPSRTLEDFGSIEFTPLSQIVSRAVAYYKSINNVSGHTHLKMTD